MAQEHIIRKNPKDKLWYVCGLCGFKNGKPLYIPVSQGYKNLVDAKGYIRHLPAAEYAAKTCKI